jgi:hypothetical protein
MVALGEDERIDAANFVAEHESHGESVIRL